jgi:hypothetical protein
MGAVTPPFGASSPHPSLTSGRKSKVGASVSDKVMSLEMYGTGTSYTAILHCFGSEIFFPDPGSQIFIPDPFYTIPDLGSIFSNQIPNPGLTRSKILDPDPHQ